MGTFAVVVGVTSVLTATAMAQNGGSASGAIPGITPFGKNYHVSFDRPEAWGLKYFSSTSLLSGLQPPEAAEGHRIGSVSVGFETGWLPTLDTGQERIGFNGKAVQDLNKAPVLARPVFRVGLPWKLTLVAAPLPPFHLFGVTAHLLAFGLERPILERERWTLSWRGYGQVGSVKGSFSCSDTAWTFAPGSPENATSCVGRSSDVATLRYAGNEIQFAYKIPSMPKLVPHVAAGGNFMDSAYQTHAPVVRGLDETRLWTRGATFSGTAGVSYLLTKRAAFTVDAFYSPLWVNRSPTSPRTNDGLFNVRALLTYTLR
ncbi:MAG TPA: hypothetical protein VNY05_17515 [Candidatus Acidoferrales bacterium]|nr:hypothetical protein [Candidatus Acidoferrales bacterium]